MLYLFVWWILLILIGLAAFPVTFRFFSRLPDRGYAFSKPLGLLLIAYPFWILTSFGLLQNTFGVILALTLLVALLAWAYGSWRSEDDSPLRWLRQNANHALAVELIFATAFFAFAYYRAFNPQIEATEKPMEFMFLNSILRSVQFPPHDAWLSGYSISYYYLGYVIVALLTRLTAVPSSYAFNLGLIMVYALSAAAVFGLAYDLVKGVDRTTEAEPAASARSRAAPYVVGFLAVLLLLVIGNLEGPFESLHNAGIGSDAFYRWLDINGLADAPRSGSLIPEDTWWWWRASRVVNDHNPVNGDHIEVIDEFPSFSFLLGDLHPHVLALPFDLLALAIALNLLGTRRRSFDGLASFLGKRLTFDEIIGALIVAAIWLIAQMALGLVTGGQAEGLPAALARSLTAGSIVSAAIVGLVYLLVVLYIRTRREGDSAKQTGSVFEWATPGFLLTAVVVGSLGMLNTWDIVTYGFVIIAAFALSQYFADGRLSARLALNTLLFGGILLVASYLLYLPFYAGLSSQVRGIAPNVFFKTPLHQYLMMFGIFVFILVSFVGVLAWQRREAVRPLLREAGTWAVLMLAIPVMIAAVGLLVLSRSAELQSQVTGLLNLGGSNQLLLDVLIAYVSALVTRPGVFLLLVALIAGIIALVRQQAEGQRYADGGTLTMDRSVVFALLLAFTGFLLTFGVEFLYVRDTFESRMNTVFKLYFQAWTLFAVAGAFGAYYVWRATRGTSRAVWAGAFGLLLALSLVYPVLSYPNRANGFSPSAGLPTLDGTAWIRGAHPDDYAGIEWLNANAPNDAVILEAPGREYSFDDRVSMATGLQTVLGWAGHELQWRGNYDEPGKREQDIEKVYTTLDLNEARSLLQKYGVQYVIVGTSEREKYGLTRPMIDKFAKLGEQVFAQGSMRIFQIEPAGN